MTAARSLVLVLCAIGIVHAMPQQARFSSSAVGVRVDALVMQNNRPVAGLTPADFEVRDNGVLQVIDSMESNDVPINAVLAFDASASTNGRKLTDLVDAGRALIDGLHPKDRGALITFSDVVTPMVPLTSDLASLRSALLQIRPAGNTAVLDGVHVALVSTLAEPGRSLVVACTDGRDTASYLLADEVTPVARRSNAVVYAVAVGATARRTALKDLTEITGGHMIEVEKSSDYKAQLQQILEEFRSRYVLSFTPQGVASGGVHKLEVKVRRGGVSVKARQSYISGG